MPALFQSRLYDRGHIYKDSYSGWYCVSDETFLADDQITHSPELGCKVTRPRRALECYGVLSLGVCGEWTPSGVGNRGELLV